MPGGGRIVRYRHDRNDPFSLSSDEIKAILEDKTGDVLEMNERLLARR
jgi:hypothetical protein